MPNKTLYIKDADLPLWDLAMTTFGKSISSLFSDFLRERFPSSIDTFVHVVNTGRIADQPTFAVMFAPVGETGSGGPMSPHNVRGTLELQQFLRAVGIPDETATEISKELGVKPSVSIRATLSRDHISTNFYVLSFTPLPVDAGAQSWNKVEVHAVPVSPLCKRWKATFHSIERLIEALRDQLSCPAQQLAAIQRSLEAGLPVVLGGSGAGIEFIVSEEQITMLGLIPED